MTDIQRRALRAMRRLTSCWRDRDVNDLWEDWIGRLESDGFDNEAESVREFAGALDELRREDASE